MGKDNKNDFIHAFSQFIMNKWLIHKFRKVIKEDIIHDINNANRKGKI